MPQQLLSDALEQAHRSVSAVKAAALLHIARVLTAFDQHHAERVLEEGLTTLAALPVDDRAAIEPQARCLIATVSPRRAFTFIPTRAPHVYSSTDKFLFDMMHHGHLQEAIEYLRDVDPQPDEAFPYGAAMEASGRSSDDRTRVEILRRAIRAARDDSRRGEGADHFFVSLFQCGWRLLPTEEARSETREIVRRILDQPDGPMTGSYGHGTTSVTFSSTRSHQLFEVLGPLRRLDPELADTLLQHDRQLAAAARTFPYGQDVEHETMPEEPRLTPQEFEAWARQNDYVVTSECWIPIAEALQSSFAGAFDVALRLYAVDASRTQPNTAPRECWPSTQDFRTILFKAGEYEGRAATRHLDRIPDPALRLLAQIALAAALARLPQVGGIYLFRSA